MIAKQLFVLVVLGTLSTRMVLGQQVCTAFVPAAGGATITCYSYLKSYHNICHNTCYASQTQAFPTRIPWPSSVARRGSWSVCVASTLPSLQNMYRRATTSWPPCSTWHVHCPVGRAPHAPKHTLPCTSFSRRRHNPLHPSSLPTAPMNS